MSQENSLDSSNYSFESKGKWLKAFAIEHSALKVITYTPVFRKHPLVKYSS
jgi:hypothetical protein